MKTSLNHPLLDAILLQTFPCRLAIPAFSQMRILSILFLSLLILMPVTTAFAAAPIAGFGKALDFDGVDDYVVLSDYKGITGSNARTVEAWINTTILNETIVSWGTDSASQKWIFRVQSDNGSKNTLRIEVNSSYAHIERLLLFKKLIYHKRFSVL